MEIADYEILREIGRGGSCVVYEARHRLMDRRVAIKTLRPEFAKDHNMIKRFRVEVLLAANLKHPNILRAYDARELQGRYFLISELASAEDLHDVVSSAGPMSVPNAVDAVCQAAAGLAHAHYLGVVHRDIKPKNLCLAEDGSVQVVDWGLAHLIEGSIEIDESLFGQQVEPFECAPASPRRPSPVEGPMFGTIMVDQEGKHPSYNPLSIDTFISESRRTRTSGNESAAEERPTWSGHIVGTPAFMAPEQTHTDNVDQRADIYGLGCTLHYLLTGRPVYEQETIREVFEAHRHGPIPSLRDQVNDVPEEIEMAFRRMVAKRVDDRYQSMSDVLADLDGSRSMPGFRIFISYRREDSLDATDRMYEGLIAHFGANAVFMDVDAIPPGVDFRSYLSQAVDQCQVVLMVIGDHWLRAMTGKWWWRKQRLRDRNDFVRIELETALQKQIPVIPILVGRTQMPRRSDLPYSLRALCGVQAAELRPAANYRHQLDSLIQSIESVQGCVRETKPP
ncbi:protein kinase [Pirellulales bacterium]|nr:protein kinase [Pirellulales bacterium]